MKRIGCVLFCVCVAGAVAGSAGAQAPAGPKVFVSVDMEGIWGVGHGEQVNPGSPEYANARRWMAEDANAVVAGLFEAGAGEVIVNDSHGGMRNIVADTLDPRASLVSGSPKPFGMMQGIDASYQAAVFVGYHARAGSAPAILDHTIASATIRGIRVNGQELPELGLNAALAGYHKVPVILLTGDTETCSQARSVLGAGLTTAAVKEAIKKYRGVYFASIGGAGALLSKTIKKADPVAYEDLGAEAVLRLEVVDFPVVVINDMYGADLYEEGK